MAFETDSLAPEDLREAAAATAQPATIVTSMTFGASRQHTWNSLLFYEEVQERPPLHLRLLLPVPIRTEGDKKRVGGEAMCLYERGHLIKRATRIVDGELYEFEVAEQALAVGGSMRLSGGRYVLRDAGPGLTEVSVETRYTSTKWPRWFWRPLEKIVCHMFHRFLLRSIRRKAELG